MPKFNFSFVDGAKVEIRKTTSDDNNRKFNIHFIDSRNDQLLYKDTIPAGHYSKCNHQYFVPWLIKIFLDETLVKEFRYTPTGNVLIQIDSSALGDTICWVPYIEEFRKKWPDCNVFCSTFHNQLFEPEYPKLNWLKRNHRMKDIQSRFRIGWYGKGEKSNRNPKDCRTLTLQEVGSSILGIEHREIRPKTPLDRRPPLLNTANPYVCITTSSTLQAKYWNNPRGWQKLIDLIKQQGYDVVLIGRDPIKVKGAIDYSGMKPMNDIKNIIQNSLFFIGISSGLSWLSWALGKHVVLISGFTPERHEFQSNCTRIINKDVCNGCMSDTRYHLHRGDWNWCPANKGTAKQFICTKAIEPEYVFEKIKERLPLINSKKAS